MYCSMTEVDNKRFVLFYGYAYIYVDTLTTVVDASVFLELFGSDASITDHAKLAVNSDEEIEMMKMDGMYTHTYLDIYIHM